MAWRRTIRSLGSGSSAGPFTATVVAASNLSVGSGVIVIFCCLGSPDRVSPLSRPSTGPVSGRLSTTTSWRAGHLAWFPVAFRPPAFASRSSCSRRGVGPSSRSAYRPRGTGPRRGFRVPHARAATGVGALCTPGTTVLIPTDGDYRPAPAASQRPVPAPRSNIPPAGLRLTRHQRGFKQFARPVFPSLWPPGWNGPPLGSRLGLRTPPTKSRRRTPRWGQAIEHGPGTTAQLTSVDLQSGSSLNACDLASHVAIAIASLRDRRMI